MKGEEQMESGEKPAQSTAGQTRGHQGGEKAGDAERAGAWAERPSGGCDVGGSRGQLRMAGQLGV